MENLQEILEKKTMAQLIYDCVIFLFNIEQYLFDDVLNRARII